MERPSLDMETTMPTVNPTILSPKTRLPPTEYRSHSQSRSPSPTRLHRSSADFDPLLSDLSPTSTLEALSTTDAIPSSGGKNFSKLQESIAIASTSERALGIRAAFAAKRLREWHAELLAWRWSITTTEQRTGFELPSAEELAQASSNAGHVAQGYDTKDTHREDGKVEEYWGSLPRHIVERCEDRMEEIMEELDALGVEELKSHALEAHIPSRSGSKPASVEPNAPPALTNYNHLNGFTAVVTATILQALPYLSRLNMLLTTWSIRLGVLRQVPSFLSALEEASIALASGWQSIAASNTSVPIYSTGITREVLNVMQPVVEDRLTAAGRRLDNMLDALEGREDTVPTQWIDKMETLEADYSDWVVEAQQKVLENEWRQHQEQQIVPRWQPGIDEGKAPSLLSSPRLPSPAGTVGSHRPPHKVSEATDDHEQHSEKFVDQPDDPEADRFGSNSGALNSKEIHEHSSALLSEKLRTPSFSAVSGRSGATAVRPVLESSLIGEGVPVETDSIEPAPTAMSFIPDKSIKNDENSIARIHSPSTATGATSNSEVGTTVDPNIVQEQSPLAKIDYRSIHPSVQAIATHHDLSPDPETEFAPKGLPKPETIYDIPAQSPLTTSEDIKPSKQQPDPQPDKRNPKPLSDAALDGRTLDSPTQDNSGGLLISKPDDVDLPTSIPLQVHIEESRPSLVTKTEPTLDIRKPSSEPSHYLMEQTESGLPMPELPGLPTTGSLIGKDTNAPAIENGDRLPPLAEAGAEPQAPVDFVTEELMPPHITGSENVRKKEMCSSAARDNASKPTPLALESRINTSTSLKYSDNSYPGSATSDYFSNASSPEIRDALAAKSFGKPVEVTSPTRASTVGPSSPTQPIDQHIQEALVDQDLEMSRPHTLQRNREKNSVLESTILEEATHHDPASLDYDPNKSESELRRASIASIEVLPRSEVSVEPSPLIWKPSFVQELTINQVKSIKVRRRGSSSPSLPMSSPLQIDSGRLQTPTKVSWQDRHLDGSPEAILDSPPSPPFSAATEELSPSIRRTRQRDEGTHSHSSMSSSLSVPKNSANRSASNTDMNDVDGTRLKSWRRRISHPLREDTIGLKERVKSSSSIKSTEDQLEQKISSILTTIPAKIRLTSGLDGNGRELPPSRSFSGTKTPTAPASAMRSSKSSSENPSMTLVPAFAKSSSSSTGDPEIKLYHLHKPGVAAPIKLYVRLVGEHGERVMVRVGGGWADLGEYLREYANHHGRRSVSDGRFEIKGLPQGQSSSSITTISSISNGRTTPTGRPGSALGRPSSALSVRKPRFSGGSPGDFPLPSTPDLSFSASHDLTPGSNETNNTSIRPSSRSSWTSEDAPLGLAGPKSRRIEVSPGKQAWVDGMMEQAKRASAERKGVEENEFGDLGKVGGTKRVFMISKKDG